MFFFFLILTNLETSSTLSLSILSGFHEETKKKVTTSVSDVSLVFISLTLNPIREIILHDQSMCVHTFTRSPLSKFCDLP